MRRFLEILPCHHRRKSEELLCRREAGGRGHGRVGMFIGIVIVAAGVMSFADAIRSLQSRGKFMQEAVPEGQGAMAAILGLDADAVRSVCEAAAKETNEVVSPANLNSPEQTVISGSAAGVARASFPD